VDREEACMQQEEEGVWTERSLSHDRRRRREV
jgi:hypothetical protein